MSRKEWLLIVGAIVGLTVLFVGAPLLVWWWMSNSNLSWVG